MRSVTSSTSATRSVGMNAIFIARRMTSGPEVHREQLRDPIDAFDGAGEVAAPGPGAPGVALSPMSSPWVILASSMATPHRSKPMMMLPTGSQNDCPVRPLRPTAIRATTSPAIAVASSASTRGIVGSRASRSASWSGMPGRELAKLLRSPHGSSSPPWRARFRAPRSSSRAPAARARGFTRCSMPSKMANAPPTLRSITATTNGQK